MILGVIVFSLLFLVFVVFGTLLICGKGYFLISGYRNLTDEQKVEFVSKNNLKKVFAFYAYYCYAVAVVTLVALIGACVDSMVVIFVCYLLFGAGTIATMIVANANSAYKITPVNTDIVKSTPVIIPEVPEAKKVEPKVEEKVEDKEEEKVEKVEEKVAEKKAPAKKPATKSTTTKSTTTKSTTKSTGTKSATTKKTTTKSTKPIDKAE